MVRPHSPSINRSKGKPEAVGLYGLAYYTNGLIKLCQDAGIRVAFVVDDRTVPGRTNPDNPHAEGAANAARQHGIPLWTARRFRWSVWLGKVRVPVLSGAIENAVRGSLQEDGFHIASNQVASLVGGRIRLWHPVVLGSVIDLPTHRKTCALFGYPGTGNILAQNLLHQLQSRIEDPLPWQRQLVGVLAEHYFISTSLFLREHLKDLGVESWAFNPTEFPTMTLTMKCHGQGTATIHRIPSNRHLVFPLYHSHSTPSEDLIAECERLHVPVFIITRHPFETVLSTASKIQRPPTGLIDDPTWMRNMSKGQGRWNRRLLACTDRVTVIRYEDLMSRDLATVRRVADRFGITLSDGDIQDLYEKLLFRDLESRMPGHFHQGGNEKWKKYFGRWQRALFKGYQLEPFFNQFGYDGLEDITDADVAACEPVQPPRSWHAGLTEWFARKKVGSTRPTFEARVDEGPAFPQQKAGVVSVGEAMDTTHQDPVPGPIPMIVDAKSPQVRRQLHRVFGGHGFLNLLDAGGIGPSPTPWSSLVDWGQFQHFFTSDEWGVGAA